MTVESPGATMTGPEPSTGSNLLTSPCLQNTVFHDYANPHPPVMDHCLHTDMRTYASSPNSLLMYEQEQYDMQNSLSGSCNNSAIQLDDFDLKPQFECSENFLNIDLSSLSTFSSTFDDNIRGDPVWSPQDSGLLKLEDVFQVDQSDVIQGPTLAELNCDDSITFFDDIESVLHKENEQLNMTSSFWKMQGSASQPRALPQDKKQKTSTVTTERQLVQAHSNGVQPTVKTEKSPRECASENKVAVSSDSVTQCNVDCSGVPEKPMISSVFDAESKSSLHKLLTEGHGQGLAKAAVMSQVTGVARPPLKRSRSPDTKSTDSNEEKGENVEKKWEEIKQFIHDELSAFSGPEPPAKVIKKESPDVFSPKDNDMSHSEVDEDDDENEDEGFNSEGDESDGDNMDEDNWSSDAESVESFSSIIDDTTVVGRSRKEKRYFWQYNTQSKGPKGKRLCAGLGQIDPHVLSNFEDPVFDMNLTNMKYKHNGKARRGDGNDINPSPRKLFSIGNELKKLNKIINDLTPVSELPVNARPRSRKEKNKLASRACRLKKKAQHEANKVKLFGLNHEHKKLMTVIECIRRDMVKMVSRREHGGADKLTVKLDKLIKTHLTHMIAGHTTDFVNSVVEKVANGDTSGGLNKI